MKLIRPLAALAAAVAFLVTASPARADNPKVKYTGAAATEVLASIKDGKGWCVVSAQQKVTLNPKLIPLDCVKYRVAVKYTAGQQPARDGTREDVVEVTFGDETAWIWLWEDWKMPTKPGPSFAAANAANQAIAWIEQAIPQLEELIQKETDPRKQETLKSILAVFKDQRGVLADLAKKHTEAVTTLEARKARIPAKPARPAAPVKVTTLKALAAKAGVRR
jgi:hypothetical protein